MTDSADPHPHQPGSDEADPEKQTTPAGVVRDLEDEVDEHDAELGDVDDA